MLKDNEEILIEKLQFLEKELIISASPVTRFELIQRIKSTKNELEDIKSNKTTKNKSSRVEEETAIILIARGNINYVFPFLKDILCNLDKEYNELIIFEKQSMNFIKMENRKSSKYKNFIGSFIVWIVQLQNEYFNNEDIIVSIPKPKYKPLNKVQESIKSEKRTQQNELAESIKEEANRTIFYIDSPNKEDSVIVNTLKTSMDIIQAKIRKILELESQKRYITKYWWLGVILISLGQKKVWILLISYKNSIKSLFIAVTLLFSLVLACNKYYHYYQNEKFNNVLSKIENCSRELSCLLPSLINAYEIGAITEVNNRELLYNFDMSIQPIIAEFNKKINEKKEITEEERKIILDLDKLVLLKKSVRTQFTSEEYLNMANSTLYGSVVALKTIYDNKKGMIIVASVQDEERFKIGKELYHKALKNNPIIIEDKKYHFLKFLFESSDILEELKKDIEDNPNDATAHYNLGNYNYITRGILSNIRLMNGRLFTAYDEAIRLKPNYDSAYNERGNLFVYVDLPDSAMRDYNKAIQINPNFWEAYYNRFLLESKLKNYKNACQDAKKILNIEIDDNKIKLELEQFIYEQCQ